MSRAELPYPVQILPPWDTVFELAGSLSSIKIIQQRGQLFGRLRKAAADPFANHAGAPVLIEGVHIAALALRQLGVLLLAELVGVAAVQRQALGHERALGVGKE